MAKGNKIIVTANPRGVLDWVYIDGTPKPGTFLTLKAAVEPVQEVFTYEPYARDADGDRAEVCILLENELEGKLMTVAYEDGMLVPVYWPLPGEQLNALLLDVVGTGDVHAIGERLIINDGDGKLIATTGDPESEPFVLLETVAAPVADTLARVLYTGH